MSEPWFNENTFGALYGAIVGGGSGCIGGAIGGLAGWLAPQGKGRRWILGAMVALIVFGVANLALALVALVCGQPWGIWYGPFLLGVLFTVLVSCLLPVIRNRYQEAEQRRLEAENLRNS
jgi:hypothetical protein